MPKGCGLSVLILHQRGIYEDRPDFIRHESSCVLTINHLFQGNDTCSRTVELFKLERVVGFEHFDGIGAFVIWLEQVVHCQNPRVLGTDEVWAFLVNAWLAQDNDG